MDGATLGGGDDVGGVAAAFTGGGVMAGAVGVVEGGGVVAGKVVGAAAGVCALVRTS